MKKAISFFSFFMILSSFSFVPAQTLKSLSYDWGDALYEETAGQMFDTVEAYKIKSVNLLEFTYNTDGELEGYQLFHEKIKVNSNNTLEQYNKLRFSMRSYNEILSLKARFIRKDGEVIELNKTHLKTMEQEEGKPSYKILAIEGAESGGIIEYYWVKKGFSRLFGNFILQENIPQKEIIVSISSPLNLKFISKSYNGCAEMTETIDSANNRRTLLLEIQNLQDLQEEKYASYFSNLQQVEYTLAYNYERSRNRIYSWEDAAKNLYEAVTLKKEEEKAFKNIVKKIKISGKMSEKEKINLIEKYIKTNFQLIDENMAGVDISKIQDILSTNYASKFGYVRLFTNLFKHFDITCELVVSCNKKDKYFDKDFNGYNFLEDYLLYLPDINTFIDPNSMTLRMGFIDPDYLDNYGLFLKTIKASDIESFRPYTRFIPENEYTQTSHITNVHIKMDVETFNLTYQIDHIFKGYTAQFFQPFFFYAEASTKENLLKELLSLDNTSDKLISWSAENEKPDDWFVKPFLLKAYITGDMLIGRAGPDITFKVGELIGRQVEMYREKERKMPIEPEIAKTYVREIQFEIPKGYMVSNPEILNMKVELLNHSEAEAFFYSTYTLKENLITITCTEGYKHMKFPIEKYNEYISVINAAADFNKLTLILKPVRQE